MPSVADSNLQVPPDLETAGSQVRGVALNLTDELGRLRGQIGQLEGSWSSDAYRYFKDLESLWDQSAIRLFGDPAAGNPGLLGMIADALDVAWYNYSHGEEANKHTWKWGPLIHGGGGK